MGLIHFILLLLPQGNPRKMFPHGGGLLGVTSVAMNGPQPRSPQLKQCPSMKEPGFASRSVTPASWGLFPIYTRVLRGEWSSSSFPAITNSLQPAHEEEGVITGLLPLAAPRCQQLTPGARLGASIHSQKLSCSVWLQHPPAKDSRKRWRSAGGRQAWWGWVSKPRACRVSAPRHRPPCRSAAPPRAARPHSSSTAPAPGRATGAACPGAGTPPAQGRGRGSRSRRPPGLRGPRQGPSPRHAGQAQGGSLGRQHPGSVCFSSPRREEGLWGPGAPRGRQQKPWPAGSGPAVALPRRRRGAVASSWAPGPAWLPQGFAPAKPVPRWGCPPPRLSAAPSRRQPLRGGWGQVPRPEGRGPGPLPPCASCTQGVCWGGTVGSASTSEKTAWAASASISCGQPTGDTEPIYPEPPWCRWRPGWRSSVGFLPRCPMPSQWMCRAELPMKSL